ncbi:MAG: hypothetical protein P8Z35_07280, partial [Ignavibacteriaceae bacterium]
DDVNLLSKDIETYEELGMRDNSLILAEKILKKGYPVSKLKNSPDLKNLIKDRRFKLLIEKYSK